MSHLFRALGRTWSGGDRRSEGLEAFRAFVGMRYLFGASSGRAALWLLLSALRDLLPGRSLVIIPAYTCFSVPAAVVRAGLKLLPVEIDLKTLDYDFQRLEAVVDSSALCILTCNLFGLPSDAGRVGELAHAVGAFTVDDAAQALGAVRGGQLAGTRGDAGLFSLARGKALAASGGGILVTDKDEIADAVRARHRELLEDSALRTPFLFLQNLATSVLLHPHLYWIPNSMPILKLGVTEFDPGFPVGPMPDFTQHLLIDLVGTVATLNEGRRRNASRILGMLRDKTIFQPVEPSPESWPAYIRLPMIALDTLAREKALASLRSAGIGATPYYPSAVCDIPGIERYAAAPHLHSPAAEDLAHRMLTLPTHPLVELEDMEKMAAILEACTLQEERPGAVRDPRNKTTIAARE